MITLLNKIFSQSKNFNFLNLAFQKIKKETEVKKIFKVIEEFSATSEIRYVGGCVRKAINNELIDDIDLAVNLNYKFLSNIKNDLEELAFNKYPVLKKIKIFLEKVDKVLFVRMTGSGSTIVGYFNSKKTALNAKKILKKNYKSYLCILSKTI